MIQLAVFQHVWWEGPGKFLLEAAARDNVRLDVIEVWHQQIPDLSPYDGLIILGGGPNVNQVDEYPFLFREKQAIRQRLQSDKPCLGILPRAPASGGSHERPHQPQLLSQHRFYRGPPDKRWPRPSDIQGHWHISAPVQMARPGGHTARSQPFSDPGHLKGMPGWGKDISTKQIAADAEKQKWLTGRHFHQFFRNFIRLMQKPAWPGQSYFLHFIFFAVKISHDPDNPEQHVSPA
jgi:hypothetical protein